MPEVVVGTPSRAKHELVITRTLDAPRSLVFKMWTTPEYLVRWWGPKDFTAPSIKMDFRVGGGYRACIRSSKGEEYWMTGTYREIVEPERIAFSFRWEEEGERGQDNTVTVTFTEEGTKTRMTFRQAYFDSVEQCDSHFEGWSECMDRLVAEFARKAA